MPHYSDTQHSNYTPRQIFELVADVPRYPQFIPWCRAARVLERESEHVFYAELVVAYKAFSERYTSRVELVPGKEPGDLHAIFVKMTEGPFQHLTNEWQFVPSVQGGTDIHFELDFEFRSKFLGSLINAFFAKAVSHMAAAFKKRADELYGEG